MVRGGDVMLASENLFFEEPVMRYALTKFASLSAILLVSAACTTRVEVATPKEPITINLNVKIQHEIRVKVDKELEDMFKKDKGLF
jgi:hypothetical protein